MPKKTMPHLNVKFTQEEWEEVKSVCNAHGSLTTITRTLLLRFVRGVKKAEKEGKSLTDLLGKPNQEG